MRRFPPPWTVEQNFHIEFSNEGQRGESLDEINAPGDVAVVLHNGMSSRIVGVFTGWWSERSYSLHHLATRSNHNGQRVAGERPIEILNH